MIPKKHTYNDWWSGKIHHIASPLNYNVNEITIQPIGVKWEEIKETDIPLIKAKQKELFEEQVKTLLDKWKNHFKKTYENADTNKIALQKEFNKWNQIIFKQIASPENPEIDNNVSVGGTSFDWDNLMEIRQYIRETIIPKKIRNYDFMHSPYCPFWYNSRNTNIAQSEGYAQVCWDFFNWLKALLLMQKHFPDIQNIEDCENFYKDTKREIENNLTSRKDLSEKILYLEEKLLPINNELLAQDIYKREEKDRQVKLGQQLITGLGLDKVSRYSSLPPIPKIEKESDYLSSLFLEINKTLTNLKILIEGKIKIFKKQLHLSEKEKNIYFIKDGKKQMGEYDFLKETGTIDRLKAKGITLNPTHNFELLKETRQELFEKAKQDFISDRDIKKLQTTDRDLSIFYFMWLKNELIVIEQWLNPTYPDSTKKLFGSNSDVIETLKYKEFVTDEMKKNKNAINPPSPMQFNITETVKQILKQTNPMTVGEFQKVLQQKEQEAKADPPPQIGKPTFTPEAIPDILNILNGYFPTQQAELKQLLETGNDVTNKLLFNDNGNKLAHCFKEMESHQIIKGCEKQELESWICNNFKYKYRRKIKQFKNSYLHKIISGNHTPCKFPIIKIEPTDNGFKILPIERKTKEME